MSFWLFASRNKKAAAAAFYHEAMSGSESEFLVQVVDIGAT